MGISRYRAFVHYDGGSRPKLRNAPILAVLHTKNPPKGSALGDRDNVIGTISPLMLYLVTTFQFKKAATMKQLSEDFWNIRGDFKIAHMLNIGTQMSVVRRPGGTFVLLDSYEPAKQDLDAIMVLTEGGSLIDAVLNVHPFHTIHCDFVQKLAPHARLIGTRRHHQQKPDLQWDTALIEDAATQQEFGDLFDFSVPAGVDFISDNDEVHVSSVLVRHRASRIIHADDTLMYIDLPSLLQKMVPGPELRFHPKLADGLEKRPGAADDYIHWANGLAKDWADTQKICAAHNGILEMSDQSFADAISKALDAAAPTLDKHRKKFG